MKRTAIFLVVLASACAVLAGDSSGAATSYPSPLRLLSTPSTSLTHAWTLGTTVGSADSTTRTVSVNNATDGGYYTFAPGTTNTTRLDALPSTPDGAGFVVDPAGGLSGFPAGNWSFTVATSVPGASHAGTAVLAVGMWVGTMANGTFTPSATIITPADDPLGQDLRSNFLVSTTATYAAPKFAIGAGQTLYVELWRHQVGGISDATDANRELDLVVNDGNSRVTHPAADDTGPTHALGMTRLTGAAVFDTNTGTVYYKGSAAGSFTVADTLTDGGSGALQVTYPGVGAAGWTHAAETVTSGGSFTSAEYDWTAGSTTSPGAQTIVGEDKALQTSTTTLTITNDTTGPTGQTVAPTGGPDFPTASVPLTLADGTDAGVGVDHSSGLVERAAGTPTNGTCSSFGSFSLVPLAGTHDDTVSNGGCYRYRYRVSDLLGNETTSPTSADVIVDSTPPIVTDTAPTEETGGGNLYWNSSTDTLYFRPAGSGSFELTADGSDAQSGLAGVTFPNVSSISGWSGSTGGTDSNSPFTSPTTYTWTAGAAAPGAQTVTGTNGSGVTATDTITFTADSTAPTGQTITLSGGPWFTTTSVPLTLTSGTDAGSGVDPSRAIVERASAPLTNGVCGTFGTFAALQLVNGADPTVQSGNCYRYQAKATDNVGNVSAASTVTADAKIDTTPPAAPTLQFSGLAASSVTGTTVYYRPDGTGSFTVTAGSTDADSGVSTYTFPTMTGFTALGSGASKTYTFSGAPSAPLAPLTVTATNGSGMVSDAATFTLVPDPSPPTVTVTCNGKPCSTSAYPKAVTVAITAADGTGSGLDTIRYSTDGSDPTVENGIEYADPITVTNLMQLKVRAYDKTGNASTVTAVSVNSLADQLSANAPVRIVVRPQARYLQARLTTSKRANVVAVMSGRGLAKAERWRFVLAGGSSIVQLRLPAKITRPATYRLVWTVSAGTKKVTKTSSVSLRR